MNPHWKQENRWWLKPAAAPLQVPVLSSCLWYWNLHPVGTVNCLPPTSTQTQTPWNWKVDDADPRSPCHQTIRRMSTSWPSPAPWTLRLLTTPSKVGHTVSRALAHCACQSNKAISFYFTGGGGGKISIGHGVFWIVKLTPSHGLAPPSRCQRHRNMCLKHQNLLTPLNVLSNSLKKHFKNM